MIRLHIWQNGKTYHNKRINGRKKSLKKIKKTLALLIDVLYNGFCWRQAKAQATRWNRSSAGMSVRLTCGRSWVRSPSVPLSGILLKLLHKVGSYNLICAQEWRNGRRAGFRCLLWQHSVGSSPISCIFLFGSACGSVGIGRRARLRILCWLQRVGSSPIFRTKKGNRKIPFFLSIFTDSAFDLLKSFPYYKSVL